jgi:hypothetical protein
MHDAEPISQRRGQHTRTGSCPNKGEWTDRNLNRARRGPLPDNDVELKVLHGGIENLLDHSGQSVNLIDKENIFVLKSGQDRGKIPWSLDSGAGGTLESNPQFARDNTSQ